jgi:hypothetical protein
MPAGNKPATAGRMPALPDNAWSEYPDNSEIGSREGSASMLLAQVDMLSACMTGLALTANSVDVRYAGKCMTVLRIGTKRQALRAVDFLESVWRVAPRFWRANPM